MSAGNLSHVVLAGITCSEIVSATDTRVVVRTGTRPASDFRERTGDVVIHATSGATTTKTDGWLFLAPGFIGSISPSSGRNGTIVTIGGALCGGGSAVVRVLLAGVEATIDKTKSADTCGVLTAVVREDGSQATGDITLISDSGAIVTKGGKNKWTFIAAGKIDSVSPSAGQSGTIVTITGKSLFGGGETVQAVYLNGEEGIVTQATATDEPVLVRVFRNRFDPKHKKGTGDVQVVGDTGVTVTLRNAWTFSDIETVLPNHGQRGTLVTITGTALLAGASGPADVKDVLLAEVSVDQIVSINDL